MPYASCQSPAVLSGGVIAAQLVLSTLLNGALLVPGFGLLQPLLSRVFSHCTWDSLSGLCALCNSLSSFQSL